MIPPTAFALAGRSDAFAPAAPARHPDVEERIARRSSRVRRATKAVRRALPVV